MVPALPNGAESLGPLLWSQVLPPRKQRAWDRSYGPRVSPQWSREPRSEANIGLIHRQYDNLCCYLVLNEDVEEVSKQGSHPCLKGRG